MLFRSFIAGLVFLGASIPPALSVEFHNPQLQGQIEALFQGDRDFAEIKLTIDRMVAPSVDFAANLKVIEKWRPTSSGCEF